MITIDHISFEFDANDEQFAYSLHADWDSFCRDCFEKVVEECFFAYEKDKVLYEIELLELDLGSIPEEDFYCEFSRRLKEELLKALPLCSICTANEKEKTDISRLGNLLCYLEYGYQKAEWADSDFRLTEELNWAVSQQALYTDEIVNRCLGKDYILRRLLWQTGDEKVLLRLYTVALSSPLSSLDEKRRFLGVLLEVNPSIPVRFIHQVADNAGLRNMAELLDTISVRRIMETETEEHAEVNMSQYWHYLYEWLVKYYPFNGLAIFGGKGDFVRHLHHRLLTFSRKRNYSFYLSKAELTASFLLEVFGATYYIEVLTAIYKLQPHHADGSPVYDGCFNRELYAILLQLSLLRLPMTGESKKENIDSNMEQTVYHIDMAALTEYLKDRQKSIAEKRILLGLLAKEKPEMLKNWLQTELFKDNALMAIVVEITDIPLVNRVLASVSFAAMEAVYQMRTYLLQYASEIEWLNGISESRINIAFRKAVLFWIGNRSSSQSESKSIRQLLGLVYQEVTGSDDQGAFERIYEELNANVRDGLLTELHLSEKAQEYSVGKDNIRTTIHKLQSVLADKTIAEAIKRRMLASFMEQFIGVYADAIEQLCKNGLLEQAFNLIGQPILEEIIRRLVVRISGRSNVTELLSLFYWLAIHESTVSSYLQDKTVGLKSQILVWLATSVQSQVNVGKTGTEIFHIFLTTLFYKENIPSVIGHMYQGITKDMECVDMEEALSLLLNIEIRKCDPIRAELEEWAQQSENELNMLQTVLGSRWSTDESFVDWLEDPTVSSDSKRELLQKMAVEKPQECMNLLRKQPKESKAATLIAIDLSVSRLLQSMARVNFHQAAVLSQTMEWLERKSASFPFLVGTNMLLSAALSKALLLFMQDNDTFGGRILTEGEAVNKFMSYLYLVYTGKSDLHSGGQWADLSGKMAADLELDGWPDVQNEEIGDILSQNSMRDTVLSRYIVSVMDRHSEKLLVWLERDADSASIRRIAKVSDRTMLEQWTVFLSAVAGVEHPDAFTRLMNWLSRSVVNRALISDTIGVLLSWIKDTDWRKQTPEQMAEYFISNLFGKDAIRLSTERISDATLPESVRKKLLYSHICFRPKELLEYIRHSVTRNTLSLGWWLEWLDVEDWMRLVANLSFSQAELLRQLMNCLSDSKLAKEDDLRMTLATYIISTENWIYNSKGKTISLFMKIFPILQGELDEIKKTIIMIHENLSIPKEGNEQLVCEQVEVPTTLFISNAGLSLLSPWLPRLLDRVDYLNDDRMDFKDTESKIRAIFLLQYLTCLEEKEYKETELAFNRLLVALPMHIPLPNRLELTVHERQTADSLLTGVKANWLKMNGTTMKGFQQSFITRTGRLEQQEKRWLLDVDRQAYDILLDSVPWQFKQIRLPWLTKHIQVLWQERQEF